MTNSTYWHAYLIYDTPSTPYRIRTEKAPLPKLEETKDAKLIDGPKIIV